MHKLNYLVVDDAPYNLILVSSPRNFVLMQQKRVQMVLDALQHSSNSSGFHVEGMHQNLCCFPWSSLGRQFQINPYLLIVARGGCLDGDGRCLPLQLFPRVILPLEDCHELLLLKKLYGVSWELVFSLSQLKQYLCNLLFQSKQAIFGRE